MREGLDYSEIEEKKKQFIGWFRKGEIKVDTLRLLLESVGVPKIDIESEINLAGED